MMSNVRRQETGRRGHASRPAPDRSMVRQDGWFPSVLFVVVCAYFWIGIEPFPGASDADSLAAYGNTSNVLNQLIVMAMSMTVLAVLLRHPSRHLILRSYGVLAVIFLWLAFTMVFSDAPATTLRRVVYSSLACLCASSVLLLPRDSAHFARLMGGVMLFAVCLSLFGILLLPQRAIHQASDLLEPLLAGDWRGHFGHKNTAAAAMVYATFVGLYVARNHSFKLGALLAICASAFLFNSGGKTAAAMLPVVLLAGWLFERMGSLRFLAVAGWLAIANVLLMTAAVSPAVQQLLVSVGIDPTFTDRTAIWRLALSAIADRPFTGYGFQSFWQTDALFASGQSLGTWAVTAANAHNGYLDQLINGGVPLLILVLVWLVLLPCHHASVALKRNHRPELTRLFIRIWLFSLFLSCLESPFFDNHGPLWFTTLIAVFGLRLQAYANLVETTERATPRPTPRPARGAKAGLTGRAGAF